VNELPPAIQAGDHEHSHCQSALQYACLLVWLFNVEGTLDLFAAIALVRIHEAPAYMGPAYWIPAFWVPALLVTHYITFVILLKYWKGAA
jgi:hypothetical protein